MFIWHESCSLRHVVGVKDFTELGAWQRADELREFVHEITASGVVSREYKFREQIREAADSATRNIAEGFGRYGHKEFARFVNIAIGSLDEVKDCLRAGRLRKLLTEETCEQGNAKVRMARAAMTGLLRHLKTTEAPDPFRDDPDDGPDEV